MLLVLPEKLMFHVNSGTTSLFAAQMVYFNYDTNNGYLLGRWFFKTQEDTEPSAYTMRHGILAVTLHSKITEDIIIQLKELKDKVLDPFILLYDDNGLPALQEELVRHSLIV